MWLVLLIPFLSGGKIPGENPGEKPSLGSSWLASSALTTRPQGTCVLNTECLHFRSLVLLQKQLTVSIILINDQVI